MRHLMWILTWVAVGIGGALGAAAVILLSSSPKPAATPEVVAPARGGEPVLVNNPQPAGTRRSVIYRHHRVLERAELPD
jgi:hypothetical protein